MDVREIDGPTNAPRQYWTIGGMQLMSTPDFAAPPSNNVGWLAHLGSFQKQARLGHCGDAG